ncbi:uncharacterized protein BT62DRAFT_1012074 [Guyanagaster necrorhizus]|uniref:Uncharacterized protein n=1 Tax=Guyanagaster necrorhizus TaxID=856835 RepID=A0A9P7VHY7_9AGAR|nr:uncharacterized protein BT62DRAFT_1012074 [Guyanagaster necrorhizus MCA 3950]KAG7441039.1 hypothetical protein BT62DRAFT_1012074 [Guyanagaster necrorhizus MCA 3950]
MHRAQGRHTSLAFSPTFSFALLAHMRKHHHCAATHTVIKALHQHTQRLGRSIPDDMRLSISFISPYGRTVVPGSDDSIPSLVHVQLVPYDDYCSYPVVGATASVFNFKKIETQQSPARDIISIAVLPPRLGAGLGWTWVGRSYAIGAVKFESRAHRTHHIGIPDFGYENQNLLPGLDKYSPALPTRSSSRSRES